MCVNVEITTAPKQRLVYKVVSALRRSATADGERAVHYRSGVLVEATGCPTGRYRKGHVSEGGIYCFAKLAQARRECRMFYREKVIQLRVDPKDFLGGAWADRYGYHRENGLVVLYRRVRVVKEMKLLKKKAKRARRAA